MHAVFMAKGPIFQAGQKLKPFDSINLFNLFCYVLRIKCNENDGVQATEQWRNLLLQPEKHNNLQAATAGEGSSSFSRKNLFFFFIKPSVDNNYEYKLDNHFFALPVAVAVVISSAIIILGAVAFYMRRKRSQQSIAARSYTLSGFDRFDDAAAGGEQEQLLEPNCDNTERS